MTQSSRRQAFRVLLLLVQKKRKKGGRNARCHGRSWLDCVRARSLVYSVVFCVFPDGGAASRARLVFVSIRRVVRGLRDLELAPAIRTCGMFFWYSALGTTQSWIFGSFYSLLMSSPSLVLFSMVATSTVHGCVSGEDHSFNRRQQVSSQNELFDLF